MNINITKRSLVALLVIPGLALTMFLLNKDDKKIQSAEVDALKREVTKEAPQSDSALSNKQLLLSGKKNILGVVDDEEEALTDNYESLDNASRVNLFVASIENGDDRSPPLLRQEKIEPTPLEVLNDEDKYLQFQAFERQKVMISYLKAAGPKMAFIREKIVEGKQKGISEEKLEEAQRKLRKMEQMVEELHQDYPNLKEMVALSQ